MLRLVYCVVALVLVVGLAGSPPLAAKDHGPSAVAMAGTAPEITSFFGDGGIFVGWNGPKHLKHKDIIEFHVWRDNTLGSTPVMALDPATSPAASGFDYRAIDEPVSRSLTYLAADLDHLDLVQMEATAPGITIGQPHQYWISCIYRRRHAHQFTYWETQPTYAGRATCLNRPVPVSPNEYASLDDITFEWQGSGGADEYAIEVSPSPSFEREHTWVSHVHRPTSSDGTTFSVTYAGILSNAPELAGVTDGDTLYWRVGARNSEDDPGPIPAGPSPLAEGEKNTRYIYNSADSILWFTVGDDGGGPPPPPPPF